MLGCPATFTVLFCSCPLSVGSCVELCEHLVDLLFGLCTAGVLRRRGWAGSSLFRATVIKLQPALLNLCFFLKLAHLLPQATVQLEPKILSLCENFLKLPCSIYVSWWCLCVLVVWVHVWGWWHALWSHVQGCFLFAHFVLKSTFGLAWYGTVISVTLFIIVFMKINIHGLLISYNLLVNIVSIVSHHSELMFMNIICVIEYQSYYFICILQMFWVLF